MAKRNFYLDEDKFDPYQMKVINRRSDDNFIVQGCAGSGKSILALWKAKDIQNKKGGSYLIVVYNRALKQYMKDGIREIGLDANNVESINQCFYWNKDSNGNWVRGNWKRGYWDYIIVDEAQDLALDQIQVLMEYSRRALVLWGDSAQQLYASQGAASMQEIISFTKFPDERLVYNHRLPLKIARLAERLNTSRDSLVERCVNEGSEKPYILRYNSFSEQLDTVMQIINNVGYEDVGILFANTNQVREAADYFRGKGFPVEAKISDSIDLNFDTSTPKLMPYKSAKGLQFEAVFLPECSLDNEMRLNELYVAVTRTYQSLYIMHSGNLSRFLADAPRDLYDTF